MAVFLNGDAYINAGKHYNEEYLMSFMRSMSPNDVMQLNEGTDNSMSSSLTSLSVDAAFDYAVKITDEAWAVVGHGGDEFATVLRPTLHAIKSSKENAAETLKKELQWLQPLIANRADLRAEFYEYTARIREKLGQESRKKAEARGKATDGTTHHVAAVLVVDRSYKRKVAGESSK